MPLPHEQNVPLIATKETWHDVVISHELTKPQKEQVENFFKSSLMCSQECQI